MNGATCNARFGLDESGRLLRPLSLRASVIILVAILAATVLVVKLVRWSTSGVPSAVAEAGVAVAVVAPPPAAPSTGNRLVWGPPMTVVIRGEQWTVRTVMEQAR